MRQFFDDFGHHPDSKGCPLPPSSSYLSVGHINYCTPSKTSQGAIPEPPDSLVGFIAFTGCLIDRAMLQLIISIVIATQGQKLNNLPSF
jgi:hypothetical protein